MNTKNTRKVLRRFGVWLGMLALIIGSSALMTGCGDAPTGPDMDSANIEVEGEAVGGWTSGGGGGPLPGGGAETNGLKWAVD